MRRPATLALCLLAACGNDQPETEVLRIALDYPPPGTAGDPWSDIDQLRLSVARAGETTSLVESVFPVDGTAPLPDVPFGAGLVVHLVGEESGLERSYGRSCVRDVAPDAVGTVHLYFARQRSWGEAAEPRDPAPAYAIGLPDGTALFAGGDAIDRFDPIASGAFEPVDGSLIPRDGGVIVSIREGAQPGPGRALLLGGSRADQLVDTVELLQPEPAPQETVTVARTHVSAVTLVDGTVLVTGGEAAGEAATADARILQLEADAVVEDPTANPAGLGQARAGHTLTRLGDELGAEVLVVGGWDQAGDFAATVEVYQPFENAFVTLPSTVERHSHAAVRLPGGRVLLVGGFKPDGIGGEIPATDFLLYNPNLGEFTSAGSMPLVDIDGDGDGLCGSPEGAEDDVCATQFGVVDFAVTPLPDGNVLISGGRQAVDTDFDLVPDSLGDPVDSTYVATLEEVGGDFVAATTSRLAVPRAGHAAAALCDGTVLVVGGGPGEGEPAAERYNARSDIRR